MTDLVERLRERITRLGDSPMAMLHFVDGSVPLIKEAAAALEAQAKEIEALRERVSEQTRMIQNDHDLRRADISRIQTLEVRLKSAEARAETAERERDQAREALKPYVAATKHCPVTMKMCGVGEDHFRAARAITGED